uniref:Peptidase C2 calpain domain-containing protein n=1 Tax=Acrobeloides nanus TaxID=290746 RepID=A0A914D4M0_9BILA
MEDKDFISNFNKIEICHLGPDVMEGIHLAGNHDLSKNPKWMSAIYHTSFLSRKSAKYRFRISKNENEEDCVLVVAVMQKDRRVNRLDPIHIGFSIVHKSDTIKSRIKFIKKIQLHEVSCSCRVEPGEYTVIPKAEAIVDFMIRVFTNGRIESDQGEISNMDSITTNRSDSVVYNGNKFVKIC